VGAKITRLCVPDAVQRDASHALSQAPRIRLARRGAPLNRDRPTLRGGSAEVCAVPVLQRIMISTVTHEATEYCLDCAAHAALRPGHTPLSWVTSARV